MACIVFWSEIQFPDSVYLIGDGVFASSFSAEAYAGTNDPYNHEEAAFALISKIKLPNNADLVIGERAFSRCGEYSGMGTTIEFGDRPVTIKDDAFLECNGIESITFPVGSNVSEAALYRCVGLKSIKNAPSHVLLGGFNLDEGDKVPQLQYVSFMPGLTEIEGVEAIIYRADNSEDAETAFPSLKTVVLPEGVKTIKDSAFDYFTGLTTVNLPSTLETIESNAFTGCSSLTGITALPAGVREVG